jgi:hypothetical protein
MVPDRRGLHDIPLKPAKVPTERRDIAARTLLLSRIRGEFDEMPGLCLTVAQASRLFGLPMDVSARILHYLVESSMLRRSLDGRYRRRSSAA